VERPFPWRVLEDASDPGGSPSSATALPGAPPPAPPGPAAGTVDRRRRLVPAVIGLAAAAVAVVVAGAAVAGSSSTTLALPGDSGSALMADRPPTAGSPGPRKTGAVADPSAAATLLVVDVAGAVRHPGVYRLATGSRVVDAVAAAGGFGPRVDAEAASRINLAALVTDGEQVRVPSRDDAAARPPSGPGADSAGGPTGGHAGGAASGPVNLNSASAEELDTLPGIGPATAAKILAARAEAPFATVDELRSRGVVGEATFRKLHGLVTVGP
jgi:competence protein ComEA